MLALAPHLGLRARALGLSSSLGAAALARGPLRVSAAYPFLGASSARLQLMRGTLDRKANGTARRQRCRRGTRRLSNLGMVTIRWIQWTRSRRTDPLAMPTTGAHRACARAHVLRVRTLGLRRLRPTRRRLRVPAACGASHSSGVCGPAPGGAMFAVGLQFEVQRSYAVGSGPPPGLRYDPPLPERDPGTIITVAALSDCSLSQSEPSAPLRRAPADASLGVMRLCSCDW